MLVVEFPFQKERAVKNNGSKCPVANTASRWTRLKCPGLDFCGGYRGARNAGVPSVGE